MNIDRIEKSLEESNKIIDAMERNKLNSYKKATNKEELIEELNEILEENDAECLIETGEELFKDLELDSFGGMIFFLELNDRYAYFDQGQSQEEFVASVDWKTFKVNDIIDKILCT